MLRKTLLALALTSLVTPVVAWEIPFFGGSEDEAAADKGDRVGGRDWWRKHKKQAIIVPGKGYEVPGFDGYFDGNGVPIAASVDEQTIHLDNKLEREKGLLPGLDPKTAVTRVRAAAGYGPDQQTAETLFKEGVALFEEGKYDPAAVKFEAAANRWPGTELASKSLFNLGESYYFADKYKDASDAYVQLLDKHPSTPKLDATIERLWKIAQYWEQTYFGESWHAPLDYRPFAQTVPTLDTVGHAVRLYDAIRLNDPTGPRADDAIMATAEVYRRRNRFADADYHYSLLRHEYPRSEHQFEAHLLGLQAKMLLYHGPEYDSSPLLDAKRLEELTRINFSGRLTDEQRNQLTEMRAQIARAIEERDLQMAAYYEGTEHIAAAKYYLNRVAKKNPDSPAAEQARTKLAEIQGLPDSPEVPMEWLVNLFPENKQYESINSVQEIPAATLSPDGGQTMIAEGPAPGGETTTR
ncbi:Outer membrane protein assembly factor BamD [Botrimarina colliarenosi]|uniref:Outer membrane protein assembly factor BamD n=1 Tax=Botrimarina colliarenosi TaxID=2528001 RepID=A0A5C5ZYQ5_9BACT|nr:tetratricopeptide repeat protein [Botrimarina colliarenosi]TWT92316.1 Outer membrane protein assembly factor BamD [Botrimarina colliarenosi]